MRHLGVRGPDADNFVWLTFEELRSAGMVNLGEPAEPDAAHALRLKDDPEALERELGNRVPRLH